MPLDAGPDWLAQVTSGAVAVASSFVGRMMVHAGQVQLGRRKFWSKELGLETVTAVGMGLVLDAMAGHLGIDGQVRVGFVVAGSYIGPRIIEAVWQTVQSRLPRARAD
ncbi:hypothetical protein Sp245p_26125 (plasmid) [Azospirillum baldaniorum]|uniref:LydA holin phage, holin superfamily III n=2 Tax=Azospirillum baldaniorum TaxID=1064539 RepID=A0A9P1NRC0_9PROT|nr:phage holin family protein [Azospirillum baldaniorum]AWJ93302.1 hypothetical protein Sp245p_26125 [Azospirillum baldaniorum]TWA78001.1 LydA family holin superfamily III [Azospirillum brasilense]CCD02897.1 conserved protein of unknown function [Azospirillum baldaniorum]